MVRRVKQVLSNMLFTYKQVFGVVRILFPYFGPKRIPKEEVPLFASLGWIKSRGKLWPGVNLRSLVSIWSEEWNKYFETSFSITNKFLEWFESSFKIFVQRGFPKKRFLHLHLLDGPNREENFDKGETLGLWYQYGPKSETSNLKKAFQLQICFWSGSDHLSIFWYKEDSQRRGSSIWIFRMDQVARKTLTSGKP